MRFPIAFALAALAALPAAAQTAADPASGLIRLEDRSDLYGWEAVGRLDFATGGFCTATLIAPNLVLTAAHCVYGRGGYVLANPGDLTFRAGLANGTAIAESKVLRIATPPEYIPTASLGRESADNARYDVALLELALPISTQVADPFALHEGNTQGGQVSIISYGQGRAEVLSRQRRCQELGRQQGVVAFDCDVTFGSSGSPVFVKHGNRVRIASVISKMAHAHDGRKIALGMELPGLVDGLKRQLRAGRSGPRAKERRIKLGANRNASGAKFIRP